MGATVDTSRLNRDPRQAGPRFGPGPYRCLRRQADDTARAIAANVPVRTGALRATVGTVRDGDGYGVTYGGGLSYAIPVDARARAQRAGYRDATAASSPPVKPGSQGGEQRMSDKIRVDMTHMNMQLLADAGEILGTSAMEALAGPKQPLAIAAIAAVQNPDIPWDTIRLADIEDFDIVGKDANPKAPGAGNGDVPQPSLVSGPSTRPT